MKYRAEIDGLRALAVVPVILYHAGFGLFGGGYVGVDVFFVISGYLITTLILGDIETGNFSLLRFYERRARRILPALIFVTFVTVGAGWIFLHPIAAAKLGKYVLGVATFSSNIFFWLKGGYFEDASELNPLIHTWSLAVEEQYYIFFPLALMGLSFVGIRRYRLLFLIAGGLSLGLSVWAAVVQDNPLISSGAFFLLPTRGWELLIGAYGALICRQRPVPEIGPAPLRQFLSLLGLALIALSCVIFTPDTPFPGYAALMPTIGAFWVIVYGGHGTLAARVLSHRYLVFIGLISYSLYLWHQPIFAIYRNVVGETEIPTGVVTLLILLAFALAYLTWRFIERPFRNRAYLSTGKVMLLSGLSLAAIAAFGIVTKQATKGFEAELARALAENAYIYYGNLDDRKFTADRLIVETRQPKIIVMGSSRLMQAGNQTFGDEVLNLSVSGAAVEDMIALVGEANAKFDVAKVYLAADPWLFNQNSTQDEWTSIAGLYQNWVSQLQSDDPQRGPYLTGLQRDQGGLNAVFSAVNIAALSTSDGRHEALAKRSSDGVMVYDQSFANKTQDQIEAGFEHLLTYQIATYQHSSEYKEKYISLIKYLKRNDIEVSIVLSPYHPGLFARMTLEMPLYVVLEDEIRQLGKTLNVAVLGSYDPASVGCGAGEFYDGMHPRQSCMAKTIAYSGR